MGLTNKLHFVVKKLLNLGDVQVFAALDQKPPDIQGHIVDHRLDH